MMSKEADPVYVFSDFLDLKNVFESIKTEKQSINFNVLQQESYEKALEIEEKNSEFYLQKSREVKNPITPAGICYLS